MATFTQILAAIKSEGVFTQFEPLMSRSDLSLTRVRSGQHALTLASDMSYELIIGQHPLSDLEFSEFHSTLRAKECASCRAPLLVLTRDHRLDALMESMNDDDAQLFCIDLAPEQVEKALNEILGVAVRVHSRLLVETSLDCTSEAARHVFQTVDISESGLLMRSENPLPLGSRIHFALSLPESNEPIRGIAEVIRHTRTEVERIDGTALRFLRLESQGRTELADFVRRQIA